MADAGPSRSRNQTTGTLLASFSCDRSCNLAQSIISRGCMQSSVAHRLHGVRSREFLSYFVPLSSLSLRYPMVAVSSNPSDRFQIVSFPFRNDVQEALGFIVLVDRSTRVANSSSVASPLYRLRNERFDRGIIELTRVSFAIISRFVESCFRLNERMSSLMVPLWVRSRFPRLFDNSTVGVGYPL